MQADKPYLKIQAGNSVFYVIKTKDKQYPEEIFWVLLVFFIDFLPIVQPKQSLASTSGAQYRSKRGSVMGCHGGPDVSYCNPLAWGVRCALEMFHKILAMNIPSLTAKSTSPW